MRPSTADAVVAAVLSAVATFVYVAWHQTGAPWAGTAAGHLLGIVGTLLMLWAGFGYSWRKRTPGMLAPAMRDEMATHAIAGLAGPYFVLLHSGLAVRGLAGLLLLTTLLVVASGVVGRVVVGALPRGVLAPDANVIAQLDDEMAHIERQLADLARSEGPDDAGRAQTRRALQAALATLTHRQDRARTQWRSAPAALSPRRLASVWWLLHVPASLVLWVLAGAHIAATLYYGTFSR
ncbi:MAG: hypothetical protein P3B98_08285 [Gemmatimonadota bacterium]|nr:hypothetical protein [Gemmatimonadota bacterium]